MARFDIQDSTLACADIAGVVNAEVLFHMGILAAAGRNGQVRHVEAHKWFNLAAMKGIGEAADYRQEIAAQMTKDQVREALKGAREWLKLN